ncbi:MAG: hypothetical protein V3S46_02885, partial [Nitrospinota bacterium]
MENGKKLPSLKSKLLRRFIVVAIISVAIVTVSLVTILYDRDLKSSLNHSREWAQLVRTGILGTMMNTGNPTAIRDVIDTYKEVRDFKFRMIRSEYVRKQFGDREGELPRDKVEVDILNGELKEFSNVDGTVFRYVSPFVSSRRCGQCHIDLSGAPIPPGTVMGLGEFVFDISDLRADSMRLLLRDLVGDIIIIASLAILFYFLLAKDVLAPVKSIAENISRMEKEDFNLDFPLPRTEEINLLVGSISKTARVLEEKKKAREEELEAEREKLEQVRSFAVEQAGNLGIKDEDEISEIIGRLSTAVKEVEKTRLLTRISEFVMVERKEVVLSNNIETIRPTALYLTDLIEDIYGSVKKGAVELALEEAITNSMIHGNLEVPSKLKDEDFERFDRLIAERSKMPPYNRRTLRVQYDYSGKKAMFRITDGGP